MYGLLRRCWRLAAGPAVVVALAAGAASGAAPGSAGPVHHLGFVPATPAQLDASPRLHVDRASRAERPSRVVLTDYLPPIGDQGDQGSCAGWSTAYYSYTYAVAMQRGLSQEQLRDPKFQFSPAYIYNQAHSSDTGDGGGMPIPVAFQMLEDQGCATLAEMPYHDSDFRTQPGDAANARAAKFKARKFGLLFGTDPDLDELKTFLAEYRHPFVLGIDVYQDFMEIRTVGENYVYHLHSSKKLGGHAITIVGYDNAKHAFRMVNSWGPDWGDHGFLWLDENYIKEHSHNGFAIYGAGGPIAHEGRPTPHIHLLPPLRPSNALKIRTASGPLIDRSRIE